MLLPHTCAISRQKPVGTNGRRALAIVYSGVAALFLPMSAKAAISNQFSIGKAWDFFFADGTDVREGDVITRDGRKYVVSGVMPYTGLPAVSHVHAVGETQKSNG